MKFYLLQKPSRLALGPVHLPTIAIQWIPGFFPMRAYVCVYVWDIDLSPPSSAKVKNEWSCITTTPVCLQGVDRDNFTFTHFQF
jgi:hypothetical protein